MALPGSVQKFEKAAAVFKRWLVDRGSEIREPSNPFELLRFTTPEGVGVIYANKAGRVSAWENGAERAWLAYQGAETDWRVGKRVKNKGQSHQQTAIIARDGDGCWYCGKLFAEAAEGQVNFNGPDDATVEHLVSRTHGGPNHLSNLVMAHRKCNNEAGNLSVSEKVALREHMRGKS